MSFDYANCAELIDQADGLLITAGAGMGVDSGLPDFRGPQGFWRAYPALGRARIPFEHIASPSAFKTQPRLAWGFYGHRLNLYRATVPHAGFEILRRIGERLSEGCFVFTSNVPFASSASKGNIWSAEIILSLPNNVSYQGIPAA